MLSLVLRDPGVDLTRGGELSGDISKAPLTRAVRSALQRRRSGHDVDGYSDYRGARVIGAWTWLPKLNMGVVTEKEAVEAFALRDQLRWAFGVLFVLLALVVAGLVGVGHLASLLHKRTRKAEERVERLGQYTLREKLGEGGMGEVYVGDHLMLRRQTAVKLLRAGTESNPHAMARFEREVRITSQLTHPNTIAIYDYGKTPEGVLYYAMELLDGEPRRGST
ncbi:MAG: hypothetical protein JW940_26270 [Polyangiaceae bacterium]|nr:hypothetical protein [Polyangiaceae bacterium]